MASKTILDRSASRDERLAELALPARQAVERERRLVVLIRQIDADTAPTRGRQAALPTLDAFELGGVAIRPLMPCADSDPTRHRSPIIARP